MISKNKIKLINSLKLNKYRGEHNQFIAEGEKIIDELLTSKFVFDTIFSTSEGLNSIKSLKDIKNIIEVTDNELKKISTLTTPNKVLAIVNIPEHLYSIKEIANNLSIAIEDIQDPGNLGTIIRIADWFGIKDIFCSVNSVDVYNPKVVQATMGAIFRVKVHYVDLNSFLNDCKEIKTLPIYGTFLKGDNIYEQELSKSGIIIMGNESKGISKSIENIVTKKLYIPNFAIDNNGSESLNISVATAIVCSEFKRNDNVMLNLFQHP